MQPETPTKKDIIKLSTLADDINESYREARQLAEDAKRSGTDAIKAAARAGAQMIDAKNLAGHGNWGKWLDDNCPHISQDTAERWMALAKSAGVRNLENAKNLTDAYRRIGIIHAPKPPPTKGTGTAYVDFGIRIGKSFSRFKSVFETHVKVDPSEIPSEARKTILEQTGPLIEFVEKIKALEAA